MVAVSTPDGNSSAQIQKRSIFPHSEIKNLPQIIQYIGFAPFLVSTGIGKRLNIASILFGLIQIVSRSWRLEYFGTLRLIYRTLMIFSSCWIGIWTIGVNNQHWFCISSWLLYSTPIWWDISLFFQTMKQRLPGGYTANWDIAWWRLPLIFGPIHSSSPDLFCEHRRIYARYNVVY